MTISQTPHRVTGTDTYTAICDTCDDGTYLDRAITMTADAYMYLRRLGWRIDGPTYAPGTATCPRHEEAH